LGSHSERVPKIKKNTLKNGAFHHINIGYHI